MVGASMEGATMGLDMYVYASKQAPLSTVDFPVEDSSGDEIFYWRKGYALQKFFNRLYVKKGGVGKSITWSVSLTPEDITDLEVILDILGIEGARGISADVYREDLSRFIDRARRAFKDGYFLFYWESR